MTASTCGERSYQARGIPISDVISSSSASHVDGTQFHQWGQSEQGFAGLIEEMSKPGDKLLHSFVGG